MINIGDKVVISHSPMAHATGKKATVIDRMYSELANSNVFRVQIDGVRYPEATTYKESDLSLANDSTLNYSAYKVEVEVAENIVVATMYKIDNGKKEIVNCGHGHIMHDGCIGIAQATSYACKKLYERINGGSLATNTQNNI